MRASFVPFEDFSLPPPLSCSLFRVLATVRRRGCSPCIQKRESKGTRDRTYNACHGGSGGKGVEDRWEGGWVVCGVDETKRKVYMTREVGRGYVEWGRGGNHHLDGQRDVDTRSLPSFRIPFHSHIPFYPTPRSLSTFPVAVCIYPRPPHVTAPPLNSTSLFFHLHPLPIARV